MRSARVFPPLVRVLTRVEGFPTHDHLQYRFTEYTSRLSRRSLMMKN